MDTLKLNPAGCAECHAEMGGPSVFIAFPGAPLSFNDGVSSNQSTTSPTLSWSASSAGTYPVHHYEIRIGSALDTGDAIGWTAVGNGLTAVVSGLSLVSCKDYYASVRAVDSDGNASTPTLGDGFRYLGTGCPVSPTGLAATVNGVQVILTWTRENTKNAINYVIQRSAINKLSYNTIATTGTAATAYVDPSPGPGNFYYRVIALGADGSSFPSSEVIAKIVSLPIPVGSFNGHIYMTTPGNCTNTTCTNSGVGEKDTLKLIWGPNGVTGANNKVDGLINKPFINSATYPAEYFCSTLKFAGYSDWYLPAKNEAVFLEQKGTLLQGFGTHVMNDLYLTSTEGYSSLSTSSYLVDCVRGFIQDGCGKQTAALVRCVRRD